jgi:hypothetical protein
MAIDRPLWLLPALMTGLALFLGTTANHAGRWYGAATAVGVLTLAVRLILVSAFDFHQIEVVAWLPWLPPLIALDLWYAVRRGATPRTVATATAALAGAAVSLWVLPEFYPYLELSGAGLAFALAVCWIVSLAAVWLGRTIGDGLATGLRDGSGPDSSPRSPAWIAPAVLAAWLTFVTVFIATAGPPA